MDKAEGKSVITIKSNTGLSGMRLVGEWVVEGCMVVLDVPFTADLDLVTGLRKAADRLEKEGYGPGKERTE